MNPIIAIVIALFTAFLTPWARPTHATSGRKVVIRSYGYDVYRKYVKKVS
jgi:hypothetical protein